MGGALIRAACRSIGPEQVIIADHDRKKAEELAAQTGCQAAADNLELAGAAGFIVLAVKPNLIRMVASEISAKLQEDLRQGISHVAVTIAAGVPSGAVRDCIGDGVPVIRIMPNTPAAVGQGMILIAAEKGEEACAGEFQELLKEAGEFLMIPESEFDRTTSISSCSPAYVYMFISALADGAVQVGVPRDQAIRLAAQTVLGSAKMVLETGIHPDQLKDQVCSPGGSTIAGVTALEENRFRYAVAQSIIQSTEKNLKLGK